MIDTSAASRRDVVRVVRGMPTQDGAGVKLTRVIGQPLLEDLDPFLLLDEFSSGDPDDYVAGFPEHPHRGFETVTYLLAGRMRHGDDRGNSGVLEPESGQWMTAGRGIVHSEMPEQIAGQLRGFQLWVNLPASDKLCEPRYQDIPPHDIAQVAFDGGIVRVLAGTFGDRSGPVRGIATDPTYLDVRLERGGVFSTDVNAAHTAFVYAYDGAITVGERTIARGDLAILGAGERIAASAGDEPAAFLLVAGQPLREPIARYGPIVMNTRAQLVRAFDDLRDGTFSRA